MNQPCCGASPARTTTTRRWTSFYGWLLPSALLAVLPKCPLCLAAYLAVATGLGISVTTAAYLRTSLIVLCVLSLAFLTIRQVRRVVAR